MTIETVTKPLSTMKKILLIALLIIFSKNAMAQIGFLAGKVLESEFKEPLQSATIFADSTSSSVVFTDYEGNYFLSLKPGNHTLTVSMIGYEKVTFPFIINAYDTTRIAEILLKQISTELTTIVVSSSMHETKLQEQIVSMIVMKPSFIENTNSTQMDEALNKLPGVNIIDGQANIRGGSGYSYGAGSRVLVLVDDLPQLTADAGDVKWDFLPVENLEQVEVIKGASSTLYGSSALNGVINVRTSYPGVKPVTQINFYEGVYFNPARKQIQWWNNKQPYYNGGYFYHSQRFGRLDFVMGGNVFNEESFKQGDFTERGRLNCNLRYHFKKVPGLIAGINGNYQVNKSGTFFIWANDTTGTYLPFGGPSTDTTSSITEGTNTRFNLDPFVSYFSKKGDKHSINTRYFFTNNVNSKDQGSNSKLYYGQYAFTKKLKHGLTLNLGLVESYSKVESQLYGNHDGSNEAVYIQLEEKHKRLTILGGIRYETFRLDTVIGNSKPVYRAGLNYRIGKGTYFRASYGMGYRFPTIAEKFVRTGIGSLNVYPNPDVQPESGWSVELGAMQGFKINKWLGYVDLAGFRTDYKNFMEFKFGQWGEPLPPLYGIGFKSVNVENASITGIEAELIGQGTFFKLPVNLMLGFTHINPIDLNQQLYIDSVFTANTSLSTQVHDSLQNSVYLKYRYKNTLKADFDINYKLLSIGGSFRYNSFMINIDPFFEGKDPLFPYPLIPGIASYRKEHNQGDFVIDIRVGIKLNKYAKISIVCKNLLNREYSERPAMIEQPRSLTIQCGVKF